MTSTLHVDMMATARTAQWDADTFLGPGNVKALAPAKVNLFLTVGEGPGGLKAAKHPVTTVMHALTLHDVLLMNAAALNGDDPRFAAESLPAWQAVGGPSGNLLVSIDMAEKGGAALDPVTAEDNLVFKALDALARAVGKDEPCEIKVRVEKHIPSQAGLGGGSSDAAAALLAAAKLWGLDGDDERIEQTARQLGADVVFFLYGGCALLEGAGDHFVRALKPAKDTLVIIRPDEGVNTAKAYGLYDANPQPASAELEKCALAACDGAEVPHFNSLTTAAESLVPAIADIRSWAVAQTGVSDALLCGSGSCVAVFADGMDSAVALCAAAGKRGWWARTTSLSRLSACVMGA